VSSYVRLRVSAETYAIPVENVIEVADLGPVTPVPGARPELLGIRNMRGQILPVVHLARLLGIGRNAPPGRLLVAEAAGHRAGLAVDEVSGICELGDPADETDSDLLAGAALSEGDLIGIIDVPRLFDVLSGPQP
jgi:purine-binding chemotaxis protein CheW